MGVGAGSDAKDRGQSVRSLHGTFYRLISSNYQNEEKGVIGMKKTVVIVFAFILMLSLVGCNQQQPDNYDVTPNPTEVSADRIGEKVGEVTCGVPKVYTDGAGNVSSSEPENGASFLCGIGTGIFSVIGNDNVVAAHDDGKYYLYVSEKYPTGFVGRNLYVIVNGELMVYERYQPGIGDFTPQAVLGSFETETEIEGIIWEVYSTEEYPDLSYVLVISGTNSSWTYRVAEQ